MDETQEITLSKFFEKSEIREMKRSEISPATYNPRYTEEEGKRNLKRSLKNFGCLGGIVVNSRTGNTVVGGHQKIFLMDEHHKYPDNDYLLRAEVIDVDERTEKTINIALNNPNVGGSWDYDKLRELIPDIDYKAAGLSDADMNIIGVDYLLQTEEENSIASELESLAQPLVDRREQEKLQRRQEAQMTASTEMEPPSPEMDAGDGTRMFPTEEEIRQAKIDHMKSVKQSVRENAQRTAEEMDAYVVLSFSDYTAKMQFCQRFGFDPNDRFIKGEVFDEMIERID